ncbi:hypothetical protein Nepgr_016494 [Nepenthes gracilis]|uniref:RNA helicase n=1 Tax=Nepenthes gracilis TaxID=150966 RepID=A0AAD3XRP0_NEPGR|nr:hypothetical protein Nepgr_016494 [Nepenthes gracilis]
MRRGSYSSIGRRCGYPVHPWNYRRTRPPDMPCPNFVVVLRHERLGFYTPQVETLISKCKPTPDNYEVFKSGSVAARLFFAQWSCVLEAFVGLWESRFDGDHKFSPTLIPNVIVPSDVDELNDRLKTLFIDRIRGFIDGELVKRWEKKLENVSNEIAGISASLGKPNRIVYAEKLNEKKNGLKRESDLIEKRLREYRSALNCILDHLGEKHLNDSGDGVQVFRLKYEFNWSRIYHLIMRECRRLDDGLPIYAYRQEILCQIMTQQVMVLIGETGSGKSTQLVQFLADSGVIVNGSIVCTQPRKIAALSLADRVREESSGCYGWNLIGCHPSYSSAQKFDGKVIYMTDHCLLQNCMNNRSLSGISCVIVDEAHERSLNTDLLLALLKHLLCRRLDMRLIIMSATADADQLSEVLLQLWNL